MARIEAGTRVRHYESNWYGTVRETAERDPDAFQGGKVTVHEVEAGGQSWAPITVTFDELERV